MNELIVSALLASNLLVPGFLLPPTVDAEPYSPEPIPLYETLYELSDVYILAQMLAGECYSWDEQDMINAAMVVCNRVDSESFPDSVEAVITQTGFYGFNSANVPSELNLRIAEETLNLWSAKHAGEEVEWQPWLFFSAINGVNVYREVY